MATVKFDVSGSDPEKAVAGIGNPPPPGVYLAKISEMNPGFSKGEDGKPDKTRPRVEVVFHVQEKPFMGWPMWYYLTFGKGFPEQKLDQFLQAVGVANKGKRKGSFDTDEQVGKLVKIQIVGRKDRTDYDPEVKNVMSAEGAEVSEEEDETSNGELDFDTLGGEADDGDADAVAALETAAAEAGVDPDAYATWADLAEALKEAAESGGGDDENEEPDLDALGTAADDDGDVDAQNKLTELAEEKGLDPDSYPTWAELATALQESEASADDGYDDMEVNDLREECKSRGLDSKGGKPALVARLRENDADDAPF